jgi:hypothetical protein
MRMILFLFEGEGLVRLICWHHHFNFQCLFLFEGGGLGNSEADALRARAHTVHLGDASLR